MKRYFRKTLLLFQTSKKRILLLLIQMLTISLVGMVMPFIMEKLIDNGFSEKNFTSIVFYSVIAFLAYTLYSVIALLKERNRLQIYNALKMQLEIESFSHLQKIQQSYFNDKQPSSIYQTLDEDIQTISAIMGDNTLSVITSLFIGIGGCISLFLMNWRLSLLVCCFFPIKYAITHVISKKNYKHVKDYIDESREYSGWFGDMIAGIKEIRSYNLGEIKEKILINKQHRLIKTNYKRVMTACLNECAEVVSAQGMMMIIYIVAGIMLVNNGISIGQVVAFTSYALMISSSISDAINLLFDISSVTPSVIRLFDFMDEKEETMGDLESVVVQNICFDNVGFRYPGDRKVLDNVSLNVKSGEKVAIIGRNGTGKTTFLNLLIRAYQPTCGSIYINGINLNSFTTQGISSMISIVRQDVYLFNDTIRNNICCGRQIDDSEILDLCKCLNFIELLDGKMLDYQVGNNGANLSGGQKQKISIARALIRNTPIVIFDEATSNLDQQAKLGLMELFETRLKKAIVIFVTHEKDILRHFDSVYLLSDGGLKCEWEI